MKLNNAKKLLAGLSFFACSSLFAAPLVVNVSGIESNAALGNAQNTVLTFNVGANSTITSLDYSVNLTAYSPSWLSEMRLAFTDSAFTDGVLLTPGVGVNAAGTASYSDFLDLILEDLSFTVGADGILRLEFYESFNDSGVSPDGIWNFATFTFGIEPVAGEVPEPASMLLIGAGLAAMGYTGRRRRAARQPAVLAA